MKYILLLPLLIIYSCDGMYPKKDRYVAIDVNNENGMVDSITLRMDTIRVYRSNMIDDVIYDSSKFKIQPWIGNKKDTQKVIHDTITVVMNMPILVYDTSKNIK